jgi:predicted DCC family thiol-disulfide oxidoreductase YuxK
MAPSIILYDGVCGLCNRLNQFVLKRDHNDTFRFAALQSIFAEGVLSRHGVNPNDLDTVYVVVNHGKSDERLLARSDAVLLGLREIGGIWRAGASLFGVLPAVLRDWVYGCVAGNRYRIFGRFESCPLPSAKDRSKFLDV